MFLHLWAIWWTSRGVKVGKDWTMKGLRWSYRSGWSRKGKMEMLNIKKYREIECNGFMKGWMDLDQLDSWFTVSFSRLSTYIDAHLSHALLLFCQLCHSAKYNINIRLLLHQPLVTLAPSFGSLPQTTYDLSTSLLDQEKISIPLKLITSFYHKLILNPPSVIDNIYIYFFFYLLFWQ